MKYHFQLLLLFISITLNTQSQVTTSKPNTVVQQLADKIAGYNGLKHAPFSLFVKNLDTNGVVADINSNMSIAAASTMKLVTTSTAIKILGSKYRFTTKIAHSGSIDSITHTLHGDLYIIGGGDPTLGSKYYNKKGHERDFLNKWADSIYKIGIHKIEGRVIADGSIYKYQGVPSGWAWGDLGNYYGAGPNGLTIFDNILNFHFKTGKNIGDSSKIICSHPSLIPNLTIHNDVLSAKSRRDNAYMYSAPYSNVMFAKGSLPKNKKNFIVKATIPDPEHVFAYQLDYALTKAGVQIKHEATTNRLLIADSLYIKPEQKIIYTHRSPSLASIIKWTNRKSVNLFAEHLLCQISVKRHGFGSTYDGALIVKNYWKQKIDASGLFITDGSGLSRSNAVSARFFIELLTSMKSSRMLKNSLATAGKTGTMASIGRNTAASGRVTGKSGAMTRMKAYTGYVKTKTGKNLAYAMILNNYNCRTSDIKKYFQALMVKMAEY